MHASITSLVESYGYAAVFLFVGIESVGIPLPGETALVIAAAFAALGHLSLWKVIATATVAAIAGDALGYWVGRLGGVALLRRYGRVFHFSDEKLARVRGFFGRHGAKTVFFGRFIALLRTWTALLAGAAEMPYGTFTLYNVLGAVTWATIFGCLGYIFGQSLPLLERYIGQASLAMVLLIALLAALTLGWRWFDSNRDWIAGRVSHAWASFKSRYPRLGRFAAARFIRGGYLGLHLTIGFLVSVAALWLFAAITEDVVHHDPLTTFDLALAPWIRAHTTRFGDEVFVQISLIGSPLAMSIVGLAGAVWIVVRRKWLVLSAWITAFAGAGLLTVFLKNIIHRPRPSGAAEFLHGSTFSFPSGHALGSLVGYGMLAYVIGSSLRSARARRYLFCTTAVLVFAIGLSRMYLGVHYFSDVVGGYAAGALWLSACVSGVEVAGRRRLAKGSSGGSRSQMTR